MNRLDSDNKTLAINHLDDLACLDGTAVQTDCTPDFTCNHNLTFRAERFDDSSHPAVKFTDSLAGFASSDPQDCPHRNYHEDAPRCTDPGCQETKADQPIPWHQGFGRQEQGPQDQADHPPESQDPVCGCQNLRHQEADAQGQQDPGKEIRFKKPQAIQP